MNDATRARKIAELIVGCDTDYRGDLLGMVADELRLNGQAFTAKCIEAAGTVYGFQDYAPRPGRVW